MLRAIALLIGSSLGCTTTLPPSAATLNPDEQELRVGIEGGLMTINARDAPPADVLRAIGEQAGIAVSIDGDGARPVSIAVAGVSVTDGIRLLLRDVESSVIYKSVDGRLTEIRVRFMSDRAAAVASAPVPRATNATQPHELRDDPGVTPYHWHEDRLAFVRQAVRAPQLGTLGELTTLLLEDEDAAIRSSAAAALGRLRGAEAGEALSAALADRDYRVRRAAARAIGAFGGDQAIEVLENVLLDERAPQVRQMAAYALSRLGGEAAQGALEAARFDRDRSVRTIAEAALARDQN